MHKALDRSEFSMAYVKIQYHILTGPHGDYWVFSDFSYFSFWFRPQLVSKRENSKGDFVVCPFDGDSLSGYKEERNT